MNKTEFYTKLEQEKLVAVVRGENETEVTQIVDAIVKGGINIIEITFTIPNAQQIIQNLVEKYRLNTDVVIGAGTCLDEITARNALLAGAEFIVSPHFDKDIIKLANVYAVPIMPGATDVKDMVDCLRYGASVIKLFPGDTYGPSSVKSFKGPLPQAQFMPTGGVSTSNLKEWLENGVIAVGTGGSLTKGAKTGDFAAITNEAQKLVKIVRDYNHV
ncbi:bifunctional 2-keto-4-hydroxyglutarate aldolase/2-keto-3-deoxy-6-phosphogluconate aldolase [Erysipelothrix urinaevulpis]|uniref:bifunctional 2-keto-4-hydroxyglutarate aldolase/2-keto-3-deoxy-6-phosphogluconate aldolase n=1 Tax=Erysipelothrix urinaevulpis TaxID=2683717 RepID=UPI001356C696|nr:bifunctional 2-keto-4-hydroxyglutarate aldolase/2-keto-3-deoxy-6-phosphogluconate aldolase [Erysipelothrix urinaevulpis]